LGIVKFQGVFEAPPSIAPTLFKLNIAGALRLDFLSVIFVFLFLDLFDTVGTLIGVSQRGGLMVDGKMPRIGRAFFSDALGTVAGALLGTSTVTSYIESSAGINAGAAPDWQTSSPLYCLSWRSFSLPWFAWSAVRI
jgi:AGZA family xanthine/uracil permease-like MFS transporter